MNFYVYRVTTPEGKHYIGSRGSVTVPSKDLGVHYFTSSRIVAPLLCNPCKLKIVRICATRENAYQFERQYQLRVGIPYNPKFYNLSVAGVRPYTYRHSPETREKLRIAHTGRRGRHHTATTIVKMQISAKLRSTVEYRAQIGQALKFHTVSEETRRKIAFKQSQLRIHVDTTGTRKFFIPGQAPSEFAILEHR